MAKLGKNPEITRFKGLGEISPDEFKNFIGENIRLDPVIIGKDMHVEDVLEFYMGKNTPERQEFIIDNLRFEVIAETIIGDRSGNKKAEEAEEDEEEELVEAEPQPKKSRSRK